MVGGLKQEPFRKYHAETKRDSFTVNVNETERRELEAAKKILQQTKDSTAIKALAWIGAKTLHEPKIAFILESVSANKRKNQRLGIIDFD